MKTPDSQVESDLGVRGAARVALFRMGERLDDDGATAPGDEPLRTIAFACALLSLIILAGATLAGGLAYPGYDPLRQYISELGATGANTGPAVSLAFKVSGALLAAFWLMCAGLFPKSPPLLVGFGLSALNGLGLFFGGVFRCDFQCSLAAPSKAAVLHELLGGLGYLAGIAGVFVLGVAMRSRPAGRGLSNVALGCGVPAALAFGLLQPTFEFDGAAQRVLELALAVWTVAVALSVRRPAGGFLPTASAPPGTHAP
ncbi:DUF998 domain-containing protein [Corallococcus terminator]|uniref:DUF998 domain-containing protein n=1 Tax=Corallococcus terminator TaxID=2316733 RepID=UPI0013155144|nr:DUF998 domain-containing protein [Corallococcus terminator]